MQKNVALDRHRAFAGTAPSLTKLKYAYSEDLVRDWIVIHLNNLNDYCGVKEKMTLEQMNEAASVIQVGYGYLKATELMLFFFDFKMGKYGKLYGSVDPLQISNALMEFVKQRRDSLFKIDAEQRNKELLNANPNTITKEQMLQLKEKAKADINAFRKLFEGANLKNEKEVWELWKKDEIAAMKLIMK